MSITTLEYKEIDDGMQKDRQLATRCEQSQQRLDGLPVNFGIFISNQKTATDNLLAKVSELEKELSTYREQPQVAAERAERAVHGMGLKDAHAPGDRERSIHTLQTENQVFSTQFITRAR